MTQIPNSSPRKVDQIDYSKFITAKMKNVPQSGIRKYFDIAAGIEDVISLGVGEPISLRLGTFEKCVFIHWKKEKLLTHPISVFWNFVKKFQRDTKEITI
jgi:hypothetical protein